MNKLTEIKRKIKEVKGLKGALKKAESDGYSYVGLLGYKVKLSTKEHELAELLIESDIISLLEEKDKALEETVTTLEEMVDEMAFLKSEFNVGDVIGTGLFSDADDLMDKAGDIIIKRNIVHKALNTSSNSEGEQTMTPEREIKVTLLNGHIVTMNTEERVIACQLSEDFIPIIVEAESVFDDVLETLEVAQQTIARQQQKIDAALSWTWNCGEANMLEVIAALKGETQP